MKKLLLYLCLCCCLLFAFGCSEDPEENIVTTEVMIAEGVSYYERASLILEEINTLYSDYIAFVTSENEFKEEIFSLSSRMNDVYSDYLDMGEGLAITGTNQTYFLAMESLGNYISLVKVVSEKPNDGENLSREEMLSYYIQMVNLINENAEAFNACVEQTFIEL